MNEQIAAVTLLILILGIVYYFKIWKLRALLYPGAYFSLIWSLGVMGLFVFKKTDYLVEKYPEFIDELNILVASTSLSFSFFARIGRNKIHDLQITNIRYISNFKLFRFLVLLYFLVSVYVFIFEGHGFDFQSARNNVHQLVENRSDIIGYFRKLDVVLSIYAGSVITKGLINTVKLNKKKYIYLLLPFISGILFSITEGGRVSMAYSAMYYLLGASLTISLNFKWKQYLNLFLFWGGLFVFLNLMISFIGESRRTYKNDPEIALIKEKMGPFSLLLGAVEYVNSTYMGYQYRRVDAVDPNHLGYGIYTFNGFINWHMPFSSQFGLESTSIAHSLGLYYHNQETYDYERPYFDRTNSCYIPLVKDFGFYGSIFIIFIIVGITHYLFINVQRKREIKYSCSLFFYFIFLNYWATSNFYGSLSAPVLNVLYSFLIIDILNHIFGKRRKSSI